MIYYMVMVDIHDICNNLILYTMYCLFCDMFCSLMYASSGLINKEFEFMSFLQKSAIFISNSRFSLKTVNCDSLQRCRNAKLVSFWRADTALIFWIIKEHLGGINRNLESNLLKTLGENYEKSTFSPKITHLSMELELVIGTIRKGIKSTI